MKNMIKENDEISIDEWEPCEKKPLITQSEWRKEKIGENYNQEIGLDELKKIKRFLKQKIPDYQIMQTFGINAETFVSIKKNRFCAADGILKDDLDTLYFAFQMFEQDILKLKSALIATIKNACFAGEKDLIKLKSLFSKNKISLTKESEIEEDKEIL